MKMIRILFCAVLAGMLAGCGGDGGDGTTLKEKTEEMKEKAGEALKTLNEQEGIAEKKAAELAEEVKAEDGQAVKEALGKLNQQQGLVEKKASEAGAASQEDTAKAMEAAKVQAQKIKDEAAELGKKVKTATEGAVEKVKGGQETAPAPAPAPAPAEGGMPAPAEGN